MDRATLEQHLAQAEGHVALGLKHIARQHEIIAKMELAGHDTTVPRSLLATFEDVQVTHETDRDRIRAALAAVK
jgi:hypothetical protein